MRSTSSSWIFHLGVLGAVLSGVLWALNVPFYSGAGGAHWEWRMEHGRLRIEHHEAPFNPESFYVAPNSEGMRYLPDWIVHDQDDWMINVPLWVPFLLSAGVAAWGLGRARRSEAAG